MCSIFVSAVYCPLPSPRDLAMARNTCNSELPPAQFSQDTLSGHEPGDSRSIILSLSATLSTTSCLVSPLPLHPLGLLFRNPGPSIVPAPSSRRLSAPFGYWFTVDRLLVLFGDDSGSSKRACAMGLGSAAQKMLPSVALRYCYVTHCRAPLGRTHLLVHSCRVLEPSSPLLPLDH